MALWFFSLFVLKKHAAMLSGEELRVSLVNSKQRSKDFLQQPAKIQSCQQPHNQAWKETHPQSSFKMTSAPAHTLIATLIVARGPS